MIVARGNLMFLKQILGLHASFKNFNTNRPFPKCFEPHYERRAFHLGISFVCIHARTMQKPHFHNEV